MIIKIIGLTPKIYVKNTLNCFDGLITIVGIVDISHYLNF